MASETNNILPVPWSQWLDLNGRPLRNGTVWTYASDGTTPKSTFQDIAGLIPNPNPVVLNSSGMAQVLGQGSYVFSVFDVDGNLITSGATQDPVNALGISPAMLPVLQAGTLAAALALLGGQPTGQGILPAGVPLPFAGNVAPSGWALCTGQAVGRAANPNLFAALGTLWGAGDGATTFNVPDLRGNTWAGADAMGGTPANRLTLTTGGWGGATGVAATPGVLGGSEFLVTHGHVVTDPGHAHGVTVAPVTVSSGSGPITAIGSVSVISTQNAATGISLANSGIGGFGNVQPTAIGNWIIQLG